jgi:cytochrome P450
LARLEGQIALGSPPRRWPHPRLAADTVIWRDNSNLRGLAALPVTLA